MVVAVADDADQAVRRRLEQVADDAVAAAVDHAGPHDDRPQTVGARRRARAARARAATTTMRDRIDRRVLGRRIRRLPEHPDARRVDDEPRWPARSTPAVRGRLAAAIIVSSADAIDRRPAARRARRTPCARSRPARRPLRGTTRARPDCRSTGRAPRAATRARLLVVAHERRHVVAGAHQRVEHGGADVSGRAGQEDSHGGLSLPQRGLHHNSAVRRDTLIDFFDDLAARARRVPRPRRRLQEPDVHATRRSAARRAASPRGCTTPGFARATRSSSSARTGPSGSSRSGAACSAASSSCRSTTARRPTFCARVSRIVVGEARARRPGRARRSATPPARRSGRFTNIDWTPTAAAARAGRDRARRRRRDHLHVRARRPSRRASSSRTGTCWPTSCRSSARS